MVCASVGFEFFGDYFNVKTHDIWEGNITTRNEISIQWENEPQIVYGEHLTYMMPKLPKHSNSDTNNTWETKKHIFWALTKPTPSAPYA